ncbi:putative ribonuclease H-like domain-containing protein [Tanacetum coccineum]
MEKHLVIVKDDDKAIDAIPLATKPPVIVEYKLLKEDIDKEDLQTLWKLVKTKHGDTRPGDEHERVLWGDLKVMFEPDIRSDIWRNLQGYIIQKINIKFRGGLLGLKRLQGFLELLLLRNRSRIGINKWYQSFALRNFDLEVMEFESAHGRVVLQLSYLYSNLRMKTNKKNDVKARSLLLMALPNEHQLTFSEYAKTMFAAIEARFGGFKIVSKLAILGVVISQEDLNSKFLSSLPPEWNTHVVVWMNKAEIETMSIDDLYNNFKIVKQKVKKSVGASSGAQNLAFMTAPSTISTNDVNTASPQVSTASPNVNTTSPQVSTASLSDNVVYAFMVENPNGYNLLHQDLDQIRKDDLESMDLKWQLSLLSMRAKRYYQRTGKNIFINANDTAGYDKSKVECFNCHKMGHFAKECRAARSKEGQFRNQDNTRKQGNNEDTSSKAMLAIDGTLRTSIKDTSSFVKSSLNVDKETIFPVDKKVESVKPKNHEKPVKNSVRYAKMYRLQTPRGNQRNWNGQKSNQLGSDFVMYNKACFICGSFNHVRAQCKYHQREGMVYGNTYKRVNYNYTTNRTYLNAQRNMVPRAVLMKTGLKTFNTARTVNTAHPKFIDKPQQYDTGFVDSGCSRHMTGNIAYLSDFKEFDGGYVAFGGGAHGGRITRTGILKTDSLDFKDVYFVNELKFNLFSVLQMCDKKNYVLFTNTECLVLSPNFKLPDENQILLKIPRKDNIFTWVFFLTTKDETSEILKNFIKEIENLVDKKVKIIRCDNGTEFKNKVMDDFCREKGIKREYSIVRTSQQNGVAERRNRTLIEAARTMLADYKLPSTFWAEAVSTACYVQNRVLVVKPQNKTPYEHFKGKFDGKSDEGFFVGYSLSSKACRVYNTRTKKVEENLHIRFLENKPMIEGNGPKWLFDIDSLTQSMNYVPVAAGTIINEFADASYFDSPSKDVDNGELKSAADDQKQVEEGLDNEKDKFDDDSSPKEVNVVGQHVNIVSSTLEATHVEFFSDEYEPEVDLGNITNSYTVPTTPNTRIYKDHLIENVIGDEKTSV